MTVEQGVLMVLCLSVGAIAAFSLTGDAALGTAVGAAIWLALDHQHSVRHPR